MRRYDLHGSHQWNDTIELLGNSELQIEGTADYTVTPGDPGVRTFRNGDPGYPPSPPEVEFFNEAIDKVTISIEVEHVFTGEFVVYNKDLTESQRKQFLELFEGQREQLEEHILMEHCEPDEPDDTPDYDDRGDLDVPDYDGRGDLDDSA
jgi:hypothetical protein